MKRSGQRKKSGQQKKIETTKVKPQITGIEDLEKTELSGYQYQESSLAASSTDEDENEGLGDGNIGRSKNDIFGK
jgi:hypothetical protein